MSESALLRAVRDQLRASPASYTTAQCDIELDFDIIPSSVGDLYVMVLSGGYQTHPNHATSGGVIDEVYSIDVAVVKRAPKVPRDRRRDMLFPALNSLRTEIKKIVLQIDFKYAVTTAANVIILADDSSSEGFTEPLKLESVGRVQDCPAEWFKAMPGEQVAGVMRVIHFGGARRVTTR